MADSRIWGSGLSKTMHMSPDGIMRRCTNPAKCPYKTVSLEVATEKREAEDKTTLTKTREILHDNLLALPEDHPAIMDLKKRRLPVDDPAFGWISNGKTAMRQFHDAGLDDLDLLSSGLADTESDGTGLQLFAHDRLTISVNSNIDGQTVRFYARSYSHDDSKSGFTSGLKYVSSRPPSYTIPDRDENGFFTRPYSSDLFLADRAKDEAARKHEIYVVEGQFDAMACLYGGVKNTVAAAGATSFYQDQLDRCKELCGADGKIIMCLDHDEAGLKGMEAVARRFPDENIYVTVIPDGKDPCDYRSEHGDAALRERMAETKPISMMLAEHTKRSEWPQMLADMQSIKKRVETAKYMKKLDDTVDLASLLGKAAKLRPRGRKTEANRYRERRRWVRALGVDVNTEPQPARPFSEKMKSPNMQLLAGIKLAAQRERRDLGDIAKMLPKAFFESENEEIVRANAVNGKLDDLLDEAYGSIWKYARRQH